MTSNTSDVAVCCCERFGQIVGTFSQFLEEPRVLDSDDGLIGEILHQSICLSVNGLTS